MTHSALIKPLTYVFSTFSFTRLSIRLSGKETRGLLCISEPLCPSCYHKTPHLPQKNERTTTAPEHATQIKLRSARRLRRVGGDGQTDSHKRCGEALFRSIRKDKRSYLSECETQIINNMTNDLLLTAATNERFKNN